MKQEVDEDHSILRLGPNIGMGVSDFIQNLESDYKPIDLGVEFQGHSDIFAKTPGYFVGVVGSVSEVAVNVHRIESSAAGGPFC